MNYTHSKCSLALAFALTAALTGCSTNKDFYATSGSRADGVVNMAYDIKQFETPIVRIDQAQSIAKSKCAVWGYSDAEAFGGQTEKCNQRNGFGNCIEGQVIIQYQCQGNLEASTALASPEATPYASKNGPMSKERWQQQQIQQLNGASLPYDEYQKRYQMIMGQ